MFCWCLQRNDCFVVSFIDIIRNSGFQALEIMYTADITTVIERDQYKLIFLGNLIRDINNFDISHKNCHSESDAIKTLDGETGKALEQNYFLSIHWYSQWRINWGTIQPRPVLNNGGNQSRRISRNHLIKYHCQFCLQQKASLIYCILMLTHNFHVCFHPTLRKVNTCFIYIPTTQKNQRMISWRINCKKELYPQLSDLVEITIARKCSKISLISDGQKEPMYFLNELI